MDSVETRTLGGDFLNYWTGKAVGADVRANHFREYRSTAEYRGTLYSGCWEPNKDWSITGKIIEQFEISLHECGLKAGAWAATVSGAPTMHGPTPMVAVCRAVVHAKFGDTVPSESPWPEDES